jgi:hypothetical protein
MFCGHPEFVIDNWRCGAQCHWLAASGETGSRSSANNPPQLGEVTLRIAEQR